MPAGAVQDEDGVHVLGQTGGEAGQEQVHHAGVDPGQHQGEVLAGGRPQGGEDVGPLIADLAKAGRTLTLEPPAMADPALVTDAGLILKPELDALARMGGDRRPQRRWEPLFLKRCCAGASFCGCAGRAFWREKPMRRRTRVMLEGW
jgi:hypothetical protein